MQFKFFDFIDQIKIDYIICPGYGVRAFKHTYSDYGLSYGIYQFLWNMLRLPAGAMPITVMKA